MHFLCLYKESTKEVINMFLDKIEGIEKIKSKIPYELQYFHKFGNILKLNYEQILDENSYEYINCIEVFL